MGRLFVGKRMAIWAGKPLRMQSIEKIPVALLFVEKIGNGKSHRISLHKLASSNIDAR
jgi:hypothetical protein